MMQALTGGPATPGRQQTRLTVLEPTRGHSLPNVVRRWMRPLAKQSSTCLASIAAFDWQGVERPPLNTQSGAGPAASGGVGMKWGSRQHLKLTPLTPVLSTWGEVQT